MIYSLLAASGPEKARPATLTALRAELACAGLAGSALDATHCHQGCGVFIFCRNSNFNCRVKNLGLRTSKNAKIGV